MRRAWLFFACIAAGCGGSDMGSIQFTASGEVLALGGYAFPPANPDDPAFVDGWEVKFTKLLVFTHLADQDDVRGGGRGGRPAWAFLRPRVRERRP